MAYSPVMYGLVGKLSTIDENAPVYAVEAADRAAQQTEPEGPDDPVRKRLAKESNHTEEYCSTIVIDDCGYQPLLRPVQILYCETGDKLARQCVFLKREGDICELMYQRSQIAGTLSKCFR